ncbi:MarR family winged helix-turn-helix transcriptional regulator [Gordonia sp. OPL2]|uniref:MarR family winged helix-turn-helix transcriptional regulator n=1 Tax=Gordonia sp. OPL2 TaxID=2486274 RepID=UPI00165529D5|nr:MarR family transcriptional regulator [Gordonia sp. OPL2]ROZ88027.1 MarR family transcriptional regulator [Gordonia sp. OPL2]
MARSQKPQSVAAQATDDRRDAVDDIEDAWLRERPGMDVSSVGVITRIWRLGRHFEQERNRRLGELGTDRVTLDVLAMLRRAGEPYRLTAGELTQAALITSGGISGRLDKLERAGLVTREFHPKDRRRVNVQLTKDGMTLVDHVVSDLMTHESRLLRDRLNKANQEKLSGLLRTLLSEFESTHEISEAG